MIENLAKVSVSSHAVNDYRTKVSVISFSFIDKFSN